MPTPTPTLPTLTVGITSPGDLALVSERQITVLGAVTGQNPTVDVNGIAASVTIETDSDGRVLAMLTLGPDNGFDNNVVDANFAGNSGLAATFIATGMTPGDPSQTIVSGIVLDNTNQQPVQGVTTSRVLTCIARQTRRDSSRSNLRLRATFTSLQTAALPYVKAVGLGWFSRW